MRTWRVVLLLVVLMGLARASFAQTYITGSMVPDLCAGSPDNVPNGNTVTLSGTVTKGCLGIHGTVHLANNVNLTVTTILVYADGVLDCASNPATGGTVTFTDTAPNTTTDPERFGTGLLVLGTFTCKGTPKTPFERLTAEVSAGQSSVSMAGTPTGWGTGDLIVLPDTRSLRLSESAHYGTYIPQYDERVLSGNVVSTTASVTANFAFDHTGARDTANVIQRYPHVANLTRSFLFKSANPADAAGRGHILFNAGARIDLEYLQFQDLGRTQSDSEPDSTVFNPDGSVARIGTNQIGRYEIHFHHLHGPAGGISFGGSSYQFVFVGNVMTGGSKWAVGVHDSHYGLIKDNVAYNTIGAAFMTEDCSESYNHFDGNMAMRGTGFGPRDSQTGRGPVGFFFRGPNNYVTNNVATGFQPGAQGIGDIGTGYGFKYFQQFCQSSADLAATKIPNFPGADTTSSDQTQWTATDITTLPILQFDTNETYGAEESGFSYWWVGSFYTTSRLNVAESLVKNLTIWNTYNLAVFQYESNHVTIDTLKFYGDGCEQCSGWVGQDYISNNLLVKNSDIQGAPLGGFNFASQQENSSTQTIQDTHFGGNTPDIIIQPLWSSGYKSDNIGPRHIFLNNVTCDNGDTCIAMDPTLRGATNLVVLQDVNVTQYNGVTGDNFRLFYQDAAPSAQLQVSIKNSDGTFFIKGAPIDGLTNAQAMAQFGVAYAGTVAPCATTRASISNGFACGSNPPPPPPDTVPPVVSITSPTDTATVSGTITVTATATDNVGVAGVQFKLDDLNLGPEVQAPPYQFVWSTPATTNGAHVLKAVARDAAGNFTTSTAINVTVSNAGPDVTPPTVAVTTPSSTVVGSIALTGTCTDDVACVGVQFKIDNALAGLEDTTAPYSVTYDTTVLTNTTHTITAVGRDAAGNVATSAGVVITVNNPAPPPPPPNPPPDTIPPTVAFVLPTNGSTVSGTVTITVTAADNVAVTGVKLSLDGAILTNPISTPPYTYSWNTTTVANGSHSLTATAVDLANNSASTTVTFAVGNAVPPPNPPPPTPTITLIAAPSSVTVNTPYTLTATSDSQLVHNVRLNGVLVYTGPTDCSPTLCQKVLTYTQAVAGTYTYTLTSTDPSGVPYANVVTTETVTAAPADTTPPSVTITAPASGAIVSGMVSITVSATDASGIGSVQITVDGVLLASNTSGSFTTATWNTATVAPGTHTIHAIALDTVGNQGSAGVTVTVQAPPPPPPTPDTTPPVVTWLNPLDTATLTGATTLSVNASDNIGVASVIFEVDGVQLGLPLTAPPYSALWSNPLNGPHTLRATATDAASNSTRSSINVTVNLVSTCVSDPIVLTVQGWPSGQSGRRSLTYTTNKPIVFLSLSWPLKLTVTDTRGCTASVVK